MPPIEDIRRGWCPTLHRPMETGDGLLVRLQLPRARLTAGQARAIAAAARGCGNGLVDLTSRGNLQIRGIRSATHARLVAMLGNAGVDDPAGGTRCLVSPLAGLDPSEVLDGGGIAEEIDQTLATAELAGTIPPKLAIVIDGGGLSLDDLDADIRFVAIDPNRVAVAIAGPLDDCWIGRCSPAEVASVALSIVSAFCRERGAANWAQSIRYLSPGDRQRVAECVRLKPTSPARRRVQDARIGAISIGPGRLAVGVGLPLGRLDADLLDRLASLSVHYGSGALRLSPWRSIFIPEVAEPDVPALLAGAAELGLVTEERDPRRAIIACPGAPACSRASVRTHADANRLAREVPAFLEVSTVHLSGCAKGCARQAAADLTLVGGDGRYGVVIRGNARDQPVARMEMGELIQRLKLLVDESSPTTASAKRLARAFAEA